MQAIERGFTAAAPDRVTSLAVTGVEGTLLGIDVRLPNDGNQVTVGELGIDFGVVGGFDIFSSAEGDNAAFAVSDSTLYNIDLATGAATGLGTIGDDSSNNLLGLVALSSPLLGGVEMGDGHAHAIS